MGRCNTCSTPIAIRVPGQLMHVAKPHVVPLCTPCAYTNVLALSALEED